MQLEGACWNKNYKPAPKLLVLLVSVELHACTHCQSCPSAGEADDLRSAVANKIHEDLAYANIQAKIKAAVLDCQVWVRGKLPAQAGAVVCTCSSN